jgi:DNA-binding NarL/FixJ family response regulator
MDTHNIRIFVAYGDAMSSELLVNALNNESRFKVVGSTNVSADVPDKAKSSDCDVLLISAGLQDGPLRGFWVLQQMREECSRARCLMLLDRSEQYSVLDAFRAGAKGVFCSAESNFKVLCKCVNCVYAGEIWAGNREIAYVIEAFSESVCLRVQNTNGDRLLTKREEQLVDLLAEGLSNREIARQLRLSEHTIKNYLFRMFDKVGVSNRIELVMHAVNGGKKHRPQNKSNGGAALSTPCEPLTIEPLNRL